MTDERFRALYEKHVWGVCGYVRSRTGLSRAQAEDLVADVFTVVWRRLDDVPHPPDDRVFIYRIAYRRVKNYRRSIWRALQLQRRLSSQPQSTGNVDEVGSAADSAGDRVREAISSLPAAEREALTLVLWDGFSHEEAGQLLGCSANAIGLRLHKARERLRRELETESLSEPRAVALPICEGGS
jgi:RNA polymerase sigma-70 factor (ECF subfamily)